MAKPRNNPPKKGEDAPQVAFRGGDLAVHLVVCVLLGGALGYAIDKWLGWTPWAMLLGLVMGFAAWLMTMWRVMQKA